MKRIQIIIFLFVANYLFAQQSTTIKQEKNTAASWLQTYNFNQSSFKNSPLTFGRLAFYWWHRNGVAKEDNRH
jgi:hypothetical protein